MGNTHILRLFEDILESGTDFELKLSACNRVVYVVSGEVEIQSEKTGDGLERFGENSAWFGTQLCLVRAACGHARLWRWELLATPPQSTSDPSGVVAGRNSQGEINSVPVGASCLLRDAYVELVVGSEYLLRCDRVDFPPSGVAYTHTHPGPGIRCVLFGGIDIQQGGCSRFYRPGQSWFERGPDPVLARASTIGETAFVRGMLLPRSLLGTSSICYVRSKDAEKPKLQRYTRFVDEFIET